MDVDAIQEGAGDPGAVFDDLVFVADALVFGIGIVSAWTAMLDGITTFPTLIRI